MKPIDRLQREVGTNPAETRKEFLKKRFFFKFCFWFFFVVVPRR
jgi:hypothetical protein